MRKMMNGTLPGTEEEYFAIVINVLRPPAGASTGYEEMRQIVPIIEQLEAAHGASEILLEEAEWNLICARIKAPRFGVNSRPLLDMIETILNAEKVDKSALAPRLAGVKGDAH